MESCLFSHLYFLWLNEYFISPSTPELKRGLQQPSLCIQYGPMVREFTMGDVGSSLRKQSIELNQNLLKSWWISLTTEL